MDKEIARAWVKDLRSGKYEQTQSELCSADGYCCLGVLSVQLASDPRVKATGWEWRGTQWEMTIETESSVIGDTQDGELPQDILRAIGMPTYHQSEFIKMNDEDGRTFDAIADEIEKRYLAE